MSLFAWNNEGLSPPGSSALPSWTPGRLFTMVNLLKSLPLGIFPTIMTALLASVDAPQPASTRPDSDSSLPLRIVPLPQDLSTGNTVLCLSPTFDIQFDDSSLEGLSVPRDLSDAVKRMQERVKTTTHQWLSPTLGEEFFSTPTNEASNSSACQTYVDTLILRYSQYESDTESPLEPTDDSSTFNTSKTIPSIFDEAIRPVEERPDIEAYNLSLPLHGPGVIEADTSLGLFRGLTSFEQLFYLRPEKGSLTSHSDGQASPSGNVGSSSSGGASQQAFSAPSSGQSSNTARASDQNNEGSELLHGTIYAPLGPYELKDRPSFGWRAVLLDTSRNFFPKSVILKQLDTMSMVKLNVFHWHITDSNSWPLDLQAYPELAGRGAYSAEQKYSEEDIREVIRYAGERGIDVVLEIDTPGHTAIIGESHPDLVACRDKRPWEKYANQPPAGQLRFADEAVGEWTRGVFESTLDLLSSPYMGTGGDELNVNCMMEDAPTLAALRAKGWILDDALDHFTNNLHETIRERDRIPVVWQEMVLEHGSMPSILPSTIVTVWASSKDVPRVLKRGYRIVHAAADYFYLDCGQGGWIGKEGGGNSWCDPFKSWARMYSFDPYNGVKEAQKQLVIGGQTSLFAEQTDETNLEPVMWPRAAAVAELFWTGDAHGGFPQSSVEALPRMHDIRYRMVERGVRAAPLQPHWCALRPGACNLGT